MDSLATAACVGNDDGWDLSEWAASTTLAFDVGAIAGARPERPSRPARPIADARHEAEAPATSDEFDTALPTSFDWREVMPPTIIRGQRRRLPPHLRAPIVVGACALSSAAGYAVLIA